MSVYRPDKTSHGTQLSIQSPSDTSPQPIKSSVQYYSPLSLACTGPKRSEALGNMYLGFCNKLALLSLKEKLDSTCNIPFLHNTELISIIIIPES
jgi:hypothetical protein